MIPGGLQDLPQCPKVELAGMIPTFPVAQDLGHRRADEIPTAVVQVETDRDLQLIVRNVT